LILILFLSRNATGLPLLLFEMDRELNDAPGADGSTAGAPQPSENPQS